MGMETKHSQQGEATTLTSDRRKPVRATGERR
jgi:hypothetical protein